MRKKLSPQEKQELIINIFNSRAKTIDAIANETGIKYNSVRYFGKKYGAKFQRKPREDHTDKTEIVEQLRAQGNSYTEIGNLLGLTRQAIYLHMRKIKYRKNPKTNGI